MVHVALTGIRYMVVEVANQQPLVVVRGNSARGIVPSAQSVLMMTLMMVAEAIKCHLSVNEAAEGEIDRIDLPNGETGSLPFALTRTQFEQLIDGYVNRTIEVTRQVLTQARLTPEHISDVLCVGGSTRIPIIRHRLAEVFGREPNI